MKDSKKTRLKKNVPVKPILSKIKDLKSGRFETQRHIDEFKVRLGEQINRHNVIVKELGEVQHEINKLRHLIEMYAVMDGHDIMDLWEMETFAGITKKSYPNWHFDFTRTKEGFSLKK